jgi:hypothetical protein
MHVLDSYGIMITLQKDHGQRGKEGSIIGEYGNEGVLKRLSYGVHIARRPSVSESMSRAVNVAGVRAADLKAYTNLGGAAKRT